MSIFPDIKVYSDGNIVGAIQQLEITGLDAVADKALSYNEEFVPGQKIEIHFNDQKISGIISSPVQAYSMGNGPARLYAPLKITLGCPCGEQIEEGHLESCLVYQIRKDEVRYLP